MIVTNMSEKEYREYPAFNFSMLSDFERLDIREFHRKWILKEKDEEVKDYFVFGDALDTMLTDKDNFDNKFVVVDNTPTESMLEIANKYLELVKTEFSLEDDTLLLRAARIVGYQNNYKDDTLLRKLKENKVLLNYINTLKTAKGKSILSDIQYQKVLEREQIIRNSEISSYLFDMDNYEILYQPVIISEPETDKGNSLKGKLDFLVIDHKNKSIEIVDLKTTSKNIFDKFKESIVNYKYAKQACFYKTLLLKEEKYSKLIKEGYSIQNSILVVNSYEAVPRLMSYIIPEEAFLPTSLQITRNIVDIMNHIYSNQWDYPRGYETKQYTLTLEELGIKQE